METQYNYTIIETKKWPTLYEEKMLWQTGLNRVCGIDEVGRGPLAGPVVAAAVILLHHEKFPWYPQVRDSKKLTAKKREFLSICIHRDAMAVGIGSVPPKMIDDIGIVEATKLAMRYAIEKLIHPPDFLLIDAVNLPKIPVPQKAIIRGDNISISIASASIIAKVHRDRIMNEYDTLYPHYGFSRNKGYPTREHRNQLQNQGCCPIHRRSFGPVQQAMMVYDK